MSPPIIERTYALTIVCARVLQIVTDYPYRLRTPDVASCVKSWSGAELAGISHADVDVCVDALMLSNALRFDRRGRLFADVKADRVADVARRTVDAEVFAL